MESQKTSQKNFRNFLLLYRILRRIQKGMYPTQIARQLNTSKQRIFYYLIKAERLGLVEKINRSNTVFYVITKKGENFLLEVKKSSLPVREKVTRLHNLAIKFPIVQDNPQAQFDKKVEINNWIKQYSVVTFPIGITIEKTSKNVIVYFHQFSTKQQMFLTEFFSWVLRGVYYVYYYLKREKGITIDIFNGEIIREHLANASPEFNEKVEKRKTVEVSLGRNAFSIYPSQEPARAWIDRSLGNVDIETNDMIYEEKLLLMPEVVFDLAKNIDKLNPLLDNLAKQINLHLEVQYQQLETMKQLRKSLDELFALIKEMRKRGGEDHEM